MSKRTYTAESIDVHYDVKRCIHAAECVHGAPGVFDPKRKPWVDAEGGSANQIAEVIMRCPTGALTFSRKDGGSQEVPDTVNTVEIAQDGPIYVRGNIRVETADGSESNTETRAALCRCGLSSNKPFCDNSHQGEFADRAEIGVHNPTEPSGDESPLHIILAKDGPLLLRGPVTIKGSDGSSTVTEKCALCRCGQSSNKPFCDGTHKDIGFVAG